MSLIACPACGRQVSQQAPTCPQCGHPITTPPPINVVAGPKSVSTGAGWGLLLLGIAAIVGLVAAATKPDEVTMRKAINERRGPGFALGAALGSAIGTVKYEYNDRLFYATITAEDLTGMKGTIATGYFGRVRVSDP
jgi:hypothetical protein